MEYNCNFNDGEPQRDAYSLIPDKEYVKVALTIRATSDDGLTASKSSDAQMLDCEFEVIDGKYTGRKFWQYIVVVGKSGDEKKKQITENIARTQLRAILESSRNVDPQDDSEKAIEKRVVKSLWDFDEMEFVARIGIEKAALNSGFKDKNKISLIVTPNKKEYAQVRSGAGVTNEKATKKTSEKTTTNGTWKNEAEEVKSETPKSDNDIPAWAQ